MITFRDRIRADAAARDLYRTITEKLARRDWTYMRDYADAKSAVVAAILAPAIPVVDEATLA